MKSPNVIRTCCLAARRAIASIALLAAVAMLPARADAQCSAAYQGGPVISNANVVQVDWQPSGHTVSGSLDTYLASWFPAVLASAYVDMLGEYNTLGQATGTRQIIGRGSFAGRYAIVPSVTSTTVDDAQVAAELVAQINAGHLPRPTADAAGNTNTVYFVEFPPGITVTLQGSASCQAFCAYHSTTTLGSKPLLYSVMPDVTSGGCAGGCGTAVNPLDNAGSVHAHQLAEAITDPDIGLAPSSLTGIAGWYANGSSCGEIADICDGQQDTVSGHVVQKVWSNRANACISTDPALPVCTAAGGACRACVAADSGAACTGATPSCDTTPTSATYGQCVAQVASTGGGGGSGGGCASADPSSATGAGLALLAALAVLTLWRRRPVRP